MKSLALAAVVLVACTDSPEPSGPFVASHVDEGAAIIPGAPSLDVLVVLDTSTAFEPYRDIVRRELPTLIDVLGDGYQGMPDLHLGVISADPARDAQFLTTAGASSGYLTDAPTPFQTRKRNFDGDLRELLATTVDQTPSTEHAVAPIDMALRALRRPSGFLRADVALAVIFITASDDVSSAEVAAAAQALHHIHRDPRAAYVITITGANAPRLAAFREAFPQRSTNTAIDGDGYRAAFEELQRLHTWILAGPRCWSRVSKSHIECTAWSPHGVVPPCTNGETRLCWRLEPDRSCEGRGDGLIATFENAHDLTPRFFLVEMHCLSTLPGGD